MEIPGLVHLANYRFIRSLRYWACLSSTRWLLTATGVASRFPIVKL